MRHCIVFFILFFIGQNIRKVSSNVDHSNGRSNKRRTLNGQLSNGETKKGVPSREGSIPSRNGDPCNSCGTCNPNPCVCYGKVPSCPIKM